MRTDHQALKKAYESERTLSPKMVRILMQIQRFTPDKFMHIAEVTNMLADALSRNPLFYDQVYAMTFTVDEEFRSDSNDIVGGHDADDATYDQLMTINASHVREQQLLDDICKLYIASLENGGVQSVASPKDLDAFMMLNGMLYRIASPHLKLVVPLSMRKDIITMSHDNMTAGHFGRAVTVDRVASSYWWRSMTKDVEAYVDECSVCRLNKRGTIVHVPTGHLRDKALYPFHTVNMDVVGKLPVTPRGNAFIITFIDVLTNYAEAYAVKHHDEHSVAESLGKLILRHGAPKVIISDKGAEFGSKVLDQLAKKFGITIQQHAPYAHWLSGPVERFHGTLVNVLRMYANKHQNNWDNMVPYALFAYRTAKQARLNASPFYLVFGRHPRTISDMAMNTPDCVDAHLRDHIHRWVEADRTMKLIDSRSAKPALPNVNDQIIPGHQVLIMASDRDKMDPRWSRRSFRVLDVKDGTVTYEDANGRNATAHLSKVKWANPNVRHAELTLVDERSAGHEE